MEVKFGVLSETELSLEIQTARAKNEKIVMTNGCFDLLHAGHVKYLKAATVKFCDNMNLTFCEKCKGIMMASDAGTMKCRACGNEIKKKADMSLKTERSKSDIIVLEKDESTLPTIEKSCGECSNDVAFFWMIQTRSSDEPPTRFFRCTKCKHTWREYS